MTRVRASWLRSVEAALGIIFGAIFMGLAVVVTIETLLRKFFNISLQGVDELGGYALAAGSAIAFTLALLSRSHIRVDLLYARMPRLPGAILNWFAIASLAALAVFCAWMAFVVLDDSISYGSTSPTPWGTPMVYPQSVWLAGMAVFALVAVILLLRASLLFIAGRRNELNDEFQPKSLKDELREELASLKKRSARGEP